MTTLDCHNRPAPPWLVALATALGLFVGVMQCTAGCGVDDPCEKAQPGAMRALIPAIALAGCFAPTAETDAIQVTTGTSSGTSESSTSSTSGVPTTGVDATTTTSSTSSTVATSSSTAVDVPTTSSSSSSSLSSTTTDDTTTGGPVCFNYHGPSHTFLGMTSSFFVTEGCCSPSDCNDPSIDFDAEFFCRGFYGPNCFPVPGYKPGVAQEDDTKMHRGNGCYLTLQYIPGTLCYPQIDQGCTITNIWDDVKTGITDLACACPCDDEGWGDEGWSTT